jgi:hypothetical protein
VKGEGCCGRCGQSFEERSFGDPSLWKQDPNRPGVCLSCSFVLGVNEKVDHGELRILSAEFTPYIEKPKSVFWESRPAGGWGPFFKMDDILSSPRRSPCCGRCGQKIPMYVSLHDEITLPEGWEIEVDPEKPPPAERLVCPACGETKGISPAGPDPYSHSPEEKMSDQDAAASVFRSLLTLDSALEPEERTVFRLGVRRALREAARLSRGEIEGLHSQLGVEWGQLDELTNVNPNEVAPCFECDVAFLRTKLKSRATDDALICPRCWKREEK